MRWGENLKKKDARKTQGGLSGKDAMSMEEHLMEVPAFPYKAAHSPYRGAGFSPPLRLPPVTMINSSILAVVMGLGKLV